jgi:thymidylate kinase
VSDLPSETPTDDRPAFVVVEGSNGTGKSTVVRDLAAHTGAATFHYPAAFVRFRAEARLDEAVRPVARLQYYLAATMHLSDLVAEALEEGPVVCDRYLAGPASLLEAEEAMPAGELEAMVSAVLPRLVRPDVSLLLVARPDVASSRVQARADRERSGALSPVERRSVDPEFRRRRDAALRRHAASLGPVTELDTSDLDLERMLVEARALVLPALFAMRR